MIKMTWNARDASSTVSAPNSQVRPYRDMMPIMLIISRIVECLSFCFLAPTSLVFRLCRTRTATTMMKTTELNKMMARIGAKKAAKNTTVLLMKQLWKEESGIIVVFLVLKEINQYQACYKHKLHYTMYSVCFSTCMSVACSTYNPELPCSGSVITKSLFMATGITTGTMGATAWRSNTNVHAGQTNLRQ